MPPASVRPRRPATTMRRVMIVVCEGPGVRRGGVTRRVWPGANAQCGGAQVGRLSTHVARFGRWLTLSAGAPAESKQTIIGPPCCEAGGPGGSRGSAKSRGCQLLFQKKKKEHARATCSCFASTDMAGTYKEPASPVPRMVAPSRITQMGTTVRPWGRGRMRARTSRRPKASSARNRVRSRCCFSV